jgi:8-oxo-dGTP diphosphatase
MTILVVGAAIVRAGLLLAQQRAYPPSVAGLWELPGGRVEPNETPPEALRRECREELGVDVLVGPQLGPDVPIRDGLVLRVHEAALTPPDATPHPHDHHALRWLTVAQLDSVEWLPADQALVPAMRILLGAGHLA